MRFEAITREDLLIKLKALQCENTLLRNQQVEYAKDKAYISELEERTLQRKREVGDLQRALTKLRSKIYELQSKTNP